MDAVPGTTEMDELELLTALVEMYEERRYPIAPPDPIAAIKFRMEQLGLTRKDMVPFMGSKSKVSEVLNGKRPLTLAMMRALHTGLGISAEVLLKEPGAQFPEAMQDLEWSRFPLTEMAKRCWIPKVSDAQARAEELMRGFITQAGGPDAVSQALFRQGHRGRYNTKMDPYALAAWCLRVMMCARENPLKNKYVEGTLTAAILQDVARLSYFNDGPVLVREYLGKQGIHLIVVPHLPKTYLDGAAMLLPDGTPVIGLTLRHDRLDNFWFSLLHELVHVARHLSPSTRIIIDDLDLRGHDSGAVDDIEKEADEMARDSLIPRAVWDARPLEGKATAQAVKNLADQLKIHPAIIAGRIRFERNNYRLLSRHVSNGEVRKHFPESCTTAAA